MSLAIPLVPDEAYYWIWSLFPRSSYFDHPPFVSWLFSAGSTHLPLKEFVRWPAIIFGHLSLVAWFFIFKELGQIKKYPLWLALILTSPLLGLGSLIVTPDLPLVVFWSFCILFFLRLLRKEDLTSALLLGISLGLGFDSKYLAALFVPLSLIYLVREKKWKDAYWKFLILAALVSFIFALPVFYWNWKNDFASFKFQLGHGLKDQNWDWRWPLDYVGGQMLLLLPFLGLSLAKDPRPELRFLKYVSLGPLIFFFLTSFRAHVEMNWAVMAYPGFFACVALLDFSKLRFRIYFGLWGSIYLFVLLCLATGHRSWLHEKIQEPFVYKKFAQSLPQKYVPLFAINYQMAASLWFYSGSPVYKLSEASRYDFFEEFSEGRPQHSPIYVLKQTHHEYPLWMEKQKWSADVVEELEMRHEIIKMAKP